MKRQETFLAAIAAVALGGQVGFAQASPLDFCGDSENCNKGGVYNRAAVTATKVKVKQLAGPNNCEQVEKTHSANLIGNPPGDLFDVSSLVAALAEEKYGFNLKLRADCPYQVRFSTTSGCIGDKKTNISIDDQQASTPKTLAEMRGNCGTLKTNNHKFYGL